MEYLDAGIEISKTVLKVASISCLNQEVKMWHLQDCSAVSAFLLLLLSQTFPWWQEKQPASWSDALCQYSSQNPVHFPTALF